MKKSSIICVVISLLFCLSLAAQETPATQESPATQETATENATEATQTSVPSESSNADIDALYNSLTAFQQNNIKQNKYYLESIRLTNLARLALLDNKYEDTIKYSAEAEGQARRSDEYIADYLKNLLVTRMNRLIGEAKDKIDWAQTSGAAPYYEKEVAAAQGFYEAALAAKEAQNTADATAAAEQALDALKGVAAPPVQVAQGKNGAEKNLTKKDFKNQPQNPAVYHVRPWDKYGDCFWNIADWFYGSPRRWRVIYEANKDKIPEPDNPNLIEIGTVIVIPVIDGVARTGIWDTGVPFKE